MNKYTKLAADGTDLPDDAEGHLAVRVDNPLFAKPLIVAAYRAKKGPVSHKVAMKACAEHKAYDWNWRAGTVEELFLVPDRTQWPSLPVKYFPDAESYEYTWSSTVDAEDPAGCAWVVGLGGGNAGRDHQSLQGRARAVLAGQS